MKRRLFAILFLLTSHKLLAQDAENFCRVMRLLFNEAKSGFSTYRAEKSDIKDTSLHQYLVKPELIANSEFSSAYIYLDADFLEYPLYDWEDKLPVKGNRLVLRTTKLGNFTGGKQDSMIVKRFIGAVDRIYQDCFKGYHKLTEKGQNTFFSKEVLRYVVSQEDLSDKYTDRDYQKSMNKPVVIFVLSDELSDRNAYMEITFEYAMRKD